MSGNTRGLSDEEFRGTIDMLGRMKVAELKDLCKAMGFKMTGKKIDLYERIQTYFLEGKKNSDTTRLLTMRTLILKRDMGEPLPGYGPLYNAIDRGDFNPTAQPKKPAPRFVHHKGDSEPYREHSLYFTESPFYKLKRVINGSPQLMRASKGKETIDFKFLLSFEDVNLLKSKDDGVKLYLLCGQLPLTSQLAVQIKYPSPIEIQANGETLMNYKGIKGKEGTAKPADLTPYIKATPAQNKVTILYYQTEEAYLSYIYLVQTISCETIINQIKSKAHIHRDATISNIKSQNDDDDIVVSNASVTLRDPLSYTRMKYPVQSIYCKHTQCFDGLIFLQSQLQIPTWICPHCQIPINIDDLAVSDYFQDILTNVSDDVDLVRLNDDGSWEVVDSKEDTPTRKEVKSSKPEKSNTSILREEIEIISLSSDSEDDANPPATSKEIVHASSNQPQFNEKNSPSTNGVFTHSPSIFQDTQSPQGDTLRQILPVLSNTDRNPQTNASESTTFNENPQSHTSITSVIDSSTSNQPIRDNISDNNHGAHTNPPPAVNQVLNNDDTSNSAQSSLSDKVRKVSSSNELPRDLHQDDITQIPVPSSDQLGLRVINTGSTYNQDNIGRADVPSSDVPSSKTMNTDSTNNLDLSTISSNPAIRNVPEALVGGSLNNTKTNNIGKSQNDTNHLRRQIPNIFIPSRKSRPFPRRSSHSGDNALSPTISKNTADNESGARSTVVTSESNNDLNAVPTATKPSEIESTEKESTTTIDYNRPLQPELQIAKPTSVQVTENLNNVPVPTSEKSLVNALDSSNNLAVVVNRGTNINTSPEKSQNVLNDDEDEIPLAQMQRNKSTGSIMTQPGYAAYNSGGHKSITGQRNVLISRTESNPEVPRQASTTDDRISRIRSAIEERTTFNIPPPVMRSSLFSSNSHFGSVTSTESLSRGSLQSSTNGMQHNDQLADNFRYLHSDNHGPIANPQYGQHTQPESDNIEKTEQRIRAYITSQFQAEVASIERNFTADKNSLLQGTSYTKDYPIGMSHLLMSEDLETKTRLELLFNRKLAALKQTKEKYTNMLNTNLARLLQKTLRINVNPKSPVVANSNQVANRQWQNGANNANTIQLANPQNGARNTNTTDNYMPPLGALPLFSMQPSAANSRLSGGLHLSSLGQINRGSLVHAPQNGGFSNNFHRAGGTPLNQQQPILPPLGRLASLQELNTVKRQKVKGLLGIELNEDSIGLKRVTPPQNPFSLLPPTNRQHIPTRLDVLDSIPKDWNLSILLTKNPNQN